MSSLLSSQAVVLATAMAVSGSVILFALRWQKPFPDTHFAGSHNSSPKNLRSCMATGAKKCWRPKKKKKVHFAAHLVEAVEMIDRQEIVYTTDEEITDEEVELVDEEDDSPSPKRQRDSGMPANRAALYNGLLRDRLQRMTCSY